MADREVFYPGIFLLWSVDYRSTEQDQTWTNWNRKAIIICDQDKEEKNQSWLVQY